MKKRFFEILLCSLLAMALFAGCAKKEEPAASPEPSAPAATETPAEEENKDINAEAEQAYMAFLNGEMTVTTAEKFREDDGDYNYDGLLYGTYGYSELKAAIAEHEGHGSITKYALVDLGQDGVNELAVRFDNVDPSFLNWVGVIRYNGEGLELNYSYEDGYRISSTLYSSGYLYVGGSIGAGGNSATLVGFDGEGFGTDIFTEKYLYGPFAENVVYDLRADGSGITGDYGDIFASSTMEVSEYMADGAVKISVTGWSEDAEVRAKEEAFIGELEGLGAELVSDEDMSALCSLATYEAPEVSWNTWDDGEGSGDDANAEATAVISLSFPDEGFLAQTGSYYEFIADDTEYQVKVEFSTDAAVTDFRVLSLNMEDVNDEGQITFSENELYSLDTLTPDKPLVVGMAFAGDIPNMGISYVDTDGTARVYAVGTSGEDGSLLLAEVQLSA